MIIVAKNNTASDLVINSLSLNPGELYTLTPNDQFKWVSLPETFAAISNGNLLLIVDGVEITDSVKAWSILQGNTLPLSEGIGNKLAVHSSARPAISGKQFFATWSSCGDDIVNSTINKGPKTIITTQVNVPESYVDVEFGSGLGDVYIHSAWIYVEGCGMYDYLECEVIAKASPLQTIANKNFIVDDQHRIIFAGINTGTHGFAGTPNLVPNKDNTGHWDYSEVTSLVPNLTGTGAYDIYNIDMEIQEICTYLPAKMCESQPFFLNSDEAQKMPPGYKLRLIAINNSNTVWSAFIFLSLYREKTITAVKPA